MWQGGSVTRSTRLGIVVLLISGGVLLTKAAERWLFTTEITAFFLHPDATGTRCRAENSTEFRRLGRTTGIGDGALDLKCNESQGWDNMLFICRCP